MLTISRFTVENLTKGCVTDEAQPRFAFALDSDGSNVALKEAVLKVGDWETTTDSQIGVHYAGPALKPFTVYPAELTVTASNGEKAAAALTFETGRLGTPWKGEWISDPGYSFTEKSVSPIPMTFRKTFQAKGKIASAKIYATAMGIYELTINGEKVGDQYFAPGFTSYKTHLQYQTYDVTGMLTGNDTIQADVGGGWAVGSFVFTRKNRITADRQALLLELRVTYADGSQEVVGTDSSWEVTEDGNYRMTDIYDGETYDAAVDLRKANWRKAAKESLRVHPDIMADYGAPVRAHEELKPVSCNKLPSGELIYDFGQNFAGVVKFTVNGKRGQVITIKHAEILNPDGTLNVAFLRTAKATATYTCVDGVQTYSPRMTYMGFQYISVEGVEQDKIDISALALYSDVETTGSFSCSNDMLNRLQKNIEWGAKSNFVDIPTDCPQRDERMGWTGDIAVFAPTGCYNFDISRFLEKWLLDVKAEQLPSGGLPNTVPVQGYGFPATMPNMAVAWWDDACILVPWAEYQARGDVELLRKMYPSMKKYVKASKFWCSFGFGKNRYIWNVPGVLAFGDWIAPDVPQMSQWQARVKWTGTASLRNTSDIVAKVAEILGEKEDAAYYRDLSDKTADAYCSVLTDGNGKLLEEFQTAYVLPIYLNMFPDKATQDKATENLVALVEKNDYCIGTGFPGTPYILFALADNGRADVAYKMLMNTKCPSWLYEVKMGATTIWERWDGLDENGQCPIGDDGTDMMISYNHYASGAVGDFLYRRVAGLESTEAGYKSFRVKPLLGGGLTWAKGSVRTPYGVAASEWKVEKGVFTVTVTVPVGTTCQLVLPDGTEKTLGSGSYTCSCKA
ncbi:MAG: glycoside hydrolase family 78 protein [Clostridiales bacterium]|nr:glycoside hydrolase family 78 protein [Clostridiales bacterium]